MIHLDILISWWWLQLGTLKTLHSTCSMAAWSIWLRACRSCSNGHFSAPDMADILVWCCLCVFGRLASSIVMICWKWLQCVVKFAFCKWIQTGLFFSKVRHFRPSVLANAWENRSFQWRSDHCWMDLRPPSLNTHVSRVLTQSMC
jgi:hypothetical protein